MCYGFLSSFFVGFFLLFFRFLLLYSWFDFWMARLRMVHIDHWLNKHKLHLNIHIHKIGKQASNIFINYKFNMLYQYSKWKKRGEKSYLRGKPQQVNGSNVRMSRCLGIFDSHSLMRFICVICYDHTRRTHVYMCVCVRR